MDASHFPPFHTVKGEAGVQKTKNDTSTDLSHRLEGLQVASSPCLDETKPVRPRPTRLVSNDGLSPVYARSSSPTTEQLRLKEALAALEEERLFNVHLTTLRQYYRFEDKMITPVAARINKGVSFDLTKQEWISVLGRWPFLHAHLPEDLLEQSITNSDELSVAVEKARQLSVKATKNDLKRLKT